MLGRVVGGVQIDHHKVLLHGAFGSRMGSFEVVHIILCSPLFEEGGVSVRAERDEKTCVQKRGLDRRGGSPTWPVATPARA